MGRADLRDGVPPGSRASRATRPSHLVGDNLPRGGCGQTSLLNAVIRSHPVLYQQSTKLYLIIFITNTNNILYPIFDKYVKNGSTSIFFKRGVP